jgi:hypothetical protein
MMEKKVATLHMKLPANLKKRVRIAAAKAEIPMTDWVIKRLEIGLQVGK